VLCEMHNEQKHDIIVGRVVQEGEKCRHVACMAGKTCGLAHNYSWNIVGR